MTEGGEARRTKETEGEKTGMREGKELLDEAA